jgi:hypothetical protein
MVSADESQRYAIIPGVILGDNGHAFIQVLNGATGDSAYHTFPLTDFWASPDEFELYIGPNRFNSQQITLQIDTPQGRAAGEVRFEGITPWPVSWRSPGIMGWYAWAPRMECYHGVVSLDHRLHGNLALAGQTVDFDAGRGYIEKDWGESFPRAWVWFQSNHFEQPGTCITASVAIIPWLGSAFRGFIVGLWHGQTLYRFATYTGARIESLAIDDQQVAWVMRDHRYRLTLRAARAGGGLLLGPTRAEMGKRINETLNAAVKVHLTTLAGEEIFAGRGRHAGLEAHGDLMRLI